MLSALPIAATLLLSAAPAPGPPREIDNVAAFARLYGVVRFFYPSDAAAELDWNRFAVHGVSRVRAARTRPSSRPRCSSSSLPSGRASRSAPASPRRPPRQRRANRSWPGATLGPGFSAAGGPYRAKRTHRAAPAPTDGFVTLMQTVPAAALRGKAIRLRAQVRATAADAVRRRGAVAARRPAEPGHGLLRQHGRPAGPRAASGGPTPIEGTVADDAENVAFGVMAIGAVTADFDAVELAVKGATGDWTPVPIQDAGFEAADGDEKAAGSARGRRTRRSRGRRDGAPARRAVRPLRAAARGRRRRGAVPGRRSRPPERTPTSTSGRVSGPACRSR